MVIRRIDGNIILPINAPSINARLVIVELHDVSLLDAPSVVIARQQWINVPIGPSNQMPFSIPAPESNSRQSLSLRAHVNMAGDGVVASGDLITTASHPINSTGDQGQIELPVHLI
jgi:putative lipoprotein